MKSQIIYKNKIYRGFLIFEIMIAFLFFTLTIVSIYSLHRITLGLNTITINNIEDIPNYIKEINIFDQNFDFKSSSKYFQTLYGNFSKLYEVGIFTILKSDYESAYGSDNCNVRFNLDPKNIVIHGAGFNIGEYNMSTDIEVRNGYVYMTADSSVQNNPDLYILDANDPDNIHLISSLNTGRGLLALELASHYIYSLNSGTTNTLQIIDILDRSNPTLITKYKIPTPNASTTAPIPSSIFYKDKKIYIGTEKWSGPELNIIDVSNVYEPILIGSYETNTLIEDIKVIDNIVYIATADIKQFRALDVSDIKNIKEISYISPSGYQSQQGKVISLFENRLVLGRTVGGFNVSQNHELFVYSSSTDNSSDISSFDFSRDIPGGIYSILQRYPYIYIATGSLGHEFQVWTNDMDKKILDLSLGFFPRSFVCDLNNLYFTTHNSRSLFIIKNF